MQRQNCWEVKKCGREVGGAKVAELGVCPTATLVVLDGMNHGTNGGRMCWAVTGSLCGDKVQGTFAAKLPSCMQCEFYKTVQRQEGAGACKTTDALARLSR